MKLVKEHIFQSIVEDLRILRGPTDEEIDKDLKEMSPEEMLMAGAEHGVLRAVERALESGVDVHAWDDLALWVASGNGHADVVKVLLDAGADVHAEGDETLRWASNNGHAEVVKILLDAGANVHAGDDAALWGASYYGHIEIVKLLLDAGADVHAEGDAALRLASEYDHDEVLKVLKDHIAKEKKGVRESLLKKFVKDSDPISDMDIGPVNLYEKFVEDSDPIKDMHIGANAVNLYDKAIELTTTSVVIWINYIESIEGKTIQGTFKKAIYDANSDVHIIYTDNPNKKHKLSLKIKEINSYYPIDEKRYIFVIDEKTGNSYYVLENEFYNISHR